ncbi:flavodoxin domain-containing protein [Salipiger mucosus]|uniref:Protoporphyrinogen IX oxidase, oxygen-independent, HemG n=1 Tax=Salipiger mucosus DSM 16094 TaxID=1123237 RepID=S9QP35_9RHOB|nr:flavodoxin domain-containing protein [Salipiger mucosus]EPX81437.1 Protoporphyrinogen IX oxidase, oxygen-independent, HemG [Salipiger mucosus DSM 16094]
MRILVAYATTEGQTRKIARFAADRLVAAGHTVELLNAEDAGGVEIARFDAAVLAGSVHAGSVQEALIDLANAGGRALAERPTLYLQVSLCAAGKDDDEWEDLHRIADRTVEEFGWTPSRIAHVAGAFRFSEYDFFKTIAMRWIASQHGERVRRGEDREYTDWDELGRVLDDWLADAGAGTGAAAATG